MESNDCTCENIFRVIKKMIASLISTTENVMRNSNLPATDSGYQLEGINSRDSSLQHNNYFDIQSTGIYTIIIVIALILIMLGIQRRQASSIKY